MSDLRYLFVLPFGFAGVAARGGRPASSVRVVTAGQRELPGVGRSGGFVGRACRRHGGTFSPERRDGRKVGVEFIVA